MPGSPEYVLSLATKGDPATGDIVFLLTDPADQAVVRRHLGGLEELAADDIQVGPDGKVIAAPGYTVLNIGQASAARRGHLAVQRAHRQGRDQNQGLSRAFEGTPLRAYDAGCDCIKDTETGQTWTADDANGLFVASEGEALAQGWKVNVGFRNFTDVLTDPTISGPRS